MVEVIVEYDYIAQEPDELTIKKGDIIQDVVIKSGGWWKGVLKDKTGVFPDNFVKVIQKDSITLRGNGTSGRRQCKVLFSYSPVHEDELKINVGDIINITGEEEEGWLKGTLNGKEGVFPSNFIVPIAHPQKPLTREDSSSVSSDLDLKPPKLPSKPVKQLYEAKYSYEAINDDELTLKKGDIISLLSKDQQDPGWWKGELNGVVGVFPDNFVVPYDNTEENSETKDHKSNASAIKTFVASHRKSLEPKSEKLNNESAANKTQKNPNEVPSTNKTPPVPGKKPTILKKSPSSSSAGLFSEIKKRFIDVVDGGASSKPSTLKTESPEVKDNHVDNVFDQVERKPLLTDVRATRAKAPGRRLPSNIHKEDDQPGIPNGNVELLQESSDTSHNASSSSEPEEKPKLREWEKHKAPWLEEMKANQAKRTSTSPGPPSEGRIKLTPTGEIKCELIEDGTSPAEKEVDMSKSMPAIDLSRSLSPSDKRKNSIEKVEDKVPALKSKPIIPPSSSMKPTPTNKDVGLSNRHTIPTASTLQKDSSPTANKAAATAVSPKAPPTPAPSAMTKSSSATAQKPDKDKSKEENPETVTWKHHVELLERIQKLERIVAKQVEAIEDLRNKLQVESDLRMLLQEKVENYEV